MITEKNRIPLLGIKDNSEKSVTPKDMMITSSKNRTKEEEYSARFFKIVEELDEEDQIEKELIRDELSRKMKSTIKNTSSSRISLVFGFKS